MSNSPNFDPATGELLEHECAECNRLAAKVAGLEGDLDATQDKLTQAFTQIKALKTQDENRRLRHKNRPRVEAIFKDWQEVCDKGACKLTTDRHDAINAALNTGYDEQTFHLASLGAQHNNPWPEKPGKPRVTEIAIFTKGSWIEQFANAGAQWLRQQSEPQRPHLQIVPAPDRGPLERVAEQLPAGRWIDGGYMSKCPCCEGDLFIRSLKHERGELVLVDCYGNPACDRASVMLAAGLDAGELLETAHRPVSWVLPESVVGAMARLLELDAAHRREAA